MNEAKQKAAEGLAQALAAFSGGYVSDTASCHVGICSKEECCRCGDILEARAALAAWQEANES